MCFIQVSAEGVDLLLGNDEAHKAFLRIVVGYLHGRYTLNETLDKRVVDTAVYIDALHGLTPRAGVTCRNSLNAVVV